MRKKRIIPLTPAGPSLRRGGMRVLSTTEECGN